MSQLDPPKNAIRLGPGLWIEHVDLTGRYGSATDIDPLLLNLEPMWSALESECVAECCGIDAFDFSPEAIRVAAGKLGDPARTCSDLASLREALRNLPAGVYVSSRLNNYSDRAVFDTLLAHLQKYFAAYSAGAGAPPRTDA